VLTGQYSYKRFSACPLPRISNELYILILWWVSAERVARHIPGSRGGDSMKCYFDSCNRPGEPSEDFEFYVCKECSEQLERLIAEAYRLKQDEDCRQQLTTGNGADQQVPLSYSAVL
jgi:hypothetical protein